MTLQEFFATLRGRALTLDELWEVKFRTLCAVIGAHSQITREDLTAEACMELRRAAIALVDVFNDLNAACCQAILAGRDVRHPTEEDWRAALRERRHPQPARKTGKRSRTTESTAAGA